MADILGHSYHGTKDRCFSVSRSSRPHLQNKSDVETLYGSVRSRRQCIHGVDSACILFACCRSFSLIYFKHCQRITASMSNLQTASCTQAAYLEYMTSDAFRKAVTRLPDKGLSFT